MHPRAKIRLLRLARGWSQTDLAKASGVGGNLISAIEFDLIARYEQQLLTVLGYTPEPDALLATLVGRTGRAHPARAADGTRLAVTPGARAISARR